jgi:hypothetical protein
MNGQNLILEIMASQFCLIDINKESTKYIGNHARDKNLTQYAVVSC